MFRLVYILLMVPVILVQVPMWVWARVNGKKYEWWGGPQG
jgi:hypothetical protein